MRDYMPKPTEPPGGRYVDCCFHCKYWSDDYDTCRKYSWAAGPGYICKSFVKDLLPVDEENEVRE